MHVDLGLKGANIAENCMVAPAMPHPMDGLSQHWHSSKAVPTCGGGVGGGQSRSLHTSNSHGQALQPVMLGANPTHQPVCFQAWRSPGSSPAPGARGSPYPPACPRQSKRQQKYTHISHKSNIPCSVDLGGIMPLDPMGHLLLKAPL